MKALVVCFSWTGNTASVGRAIAARMNADFELVEDQEPATSTWRKMLTFVTIFRRGERAIKPPKFKPNDYPLVIIGTPIWGWRLVPVMRTYLRRYAGQSDHVAFFCTEGGSGDEGAFREMTKLTGKTPVATLAVRAPDFADNLVDVLVSEFVARISDVGLK